MKISYQFSTEKVGLDFMRALRCLGYYIGYDVGRRGSINTDSHFAWFWYVDVQPNYAPDKVFVLETQWHEALLQAADQWYRVNKSKN